MLTEYSRFDGVVAPILVVSSEMEVVYANPYARRTFPVLASSESLRSRYGEDELRAVLTSLQQGQPETLKYDEMLHLSLLFEPELGADGKFRYAYVFLVSQTSDPKDIFPILSDGELLRYMKNYIADPMNFVHRQFRLMERMMREGDYEKSLQIFYLIRRRLLRMSVFFARISDCVPEKTESGVVSDAVSALLDCSQHFKIMKYKPSKPCYLHVPRESQILMYTDILTNLYFRQKDPSVSVSTACDSQWVTITFVSGPLDIPIDTPVEEDADGIDIGMFSVRRRVEMAEGQLTVEQRTNGNVAVTLKFPALNLLIAEAVVEDPAGRIISETESFALEYLDSISRNFS
ncbi:MAG: hypothetical protein J6B54_01310 [Clostridia bacterium]|nr:hypothetical protein [Clostridia bacterium]